MDVQWWSFHISLLSIQAPDYRWFLVKLIAFYLESVRKMIDSSELLKQNKPRMVGSFEKYRISKACHQTRSSQVSVIRHLVPNLQFFSNFYIFSPGVWLASQVRRQSQVLLLVNWDLRNLSEHSFRHSNLVLEEDSWWKLRSKILSA